MDQQIRGIPLGIYPDTGKAKIIYKTPDQYLSQGSNHLIALGKDSDPNTFVMTFWTWAKDNRFKTETKGTWSCHEVILTTRQLRAFKKIELGGL
jgi:hypothetical protein